jgi:sphingolipid delta-4 desaturase
VLQRHPWLKALSFTFGRFFYPSRPANTVPKDRFFWLNLGACVGFDVVVLALFGWKALVYLLCASLFGFGPHPAGARRLQEHLAVHEEQPSCSYYGLLNWLSFNVGYHVEHHDLPLVPWSRVKQVRALAAPHYDSLFAVRSWPALLARYFLDRRYRVDHYVGMGPQLGAALGYVPLARSADAPAPATARPPRAPNARAA